MPSLRRVVKRLPYLYCRMRGHRWVMVWQSHSRTFSTMTCRRCHETGWRS